jgi:hypothetical protein
MSFNVHHIPAERLRLFVIEHKELTFCERVHLSECVRCVGIMADVAVSAIESTRESTVALTEAV